jgi:hypothetical protein
MTMRYSLEVVSKAVPVVVQEEEGQEDLWASQAGDRQRVWSFLG